MWREFFARHRSAAITARICPRFAIGAGLGSLSCDEVCADAGSKSPFWSTFHDFTATQFRGSWLGSIDYDVGKPKMTPNNFVGGCRKLGCTISLVGHGSASRFTSKFSEGRKFRPGHSTGKHLPNQISLMTLSRAGCRINPPRKRGVPNSADLGIAVNLATAIPFLNVWSVFLAAQNRRR